MAKRKEASADPFVPVEEQPYPVPKNWCWVRWGNCGDFIAGSGFKNQYQGHTEYNIPFYKVGSLKYSDVDGYLYDNSNTINEEIRNALKATLIPPNSLLFAKIGEAIRLNRRSLNLIPCCIDNNMMAFVSSACTYKYAFYWSREVDLYDYSNATTVPAIRKSNLEMVAFPLPPFPEQQRIVALIESLFAKLGEAKEKAQAVVDGFENRKAAILHKAFTGELTAKWRKEHGAGIENWEQRDLQSVCAMKITDGTHKTPTYCNADDGIPFISAKDVTTGIIRWNNIKYIIPELHKELYARLAPQVDDVLLAKNGTTGVAAIVDEEKIFDIYVTLAILRPDKGVILPRYLLNVVNSPICKRQFDEHLTGIGVPNLHLRDIKAVTIPVPTIDEQWEIINLIDGAMDKEQQAKEAAEAVLAKIDTIKKSILARAFRGELGTNDPTEPWAGEMVKKLCAE